MIIKIKIKNGDKYVLLDHDVFETLSALPKFKEWKVFENLREHSSGVPVFQKLVRYDDGKSRVESIYLSSYIATNYLSKPAAGRKLFLNHLNGDKLDCRIKNLQWEDMVHLSRATIGTKNKTGFRGVRKTPDGKYVAMISDSIKQIYLGTFATPEEAALAYNKKSIELFGSTKSLNKTNQEGIPIPFEKLQSLEPIKPRLRKPKAKPSDPINLPDQTFNINEGTGTPTEEV
ncbi:MAG: hypothetical protein RIQ89_1868 [Bacteroidota bacterium]|jgi:hypothetical protein